MLEIDDAGVTSRHWFRSRTLRWDEIRDYRIRIRPYWKRFGTREELPRRHVPANSHEVAASDMRVRLSLHGDAFTVTGERDGLDGLQLSNDVLPRLHARLGRVAHDAIARFGSLTICDREIQWRDDPPLAREDVDGFDIVAVESPAVLGGKVELRVLRAGEPYCAAELAELPNIGGLVEVAAALGYRVRGRDLLAMFGIVELPREPPMSRIL